jgi:hypothetical protein
MAFLKRGIQLLVDDPTFQHEQFSLSAHWTKRLESAYQRLHNQGKLTMERKRKPHWIGFHDLRRIMNTFIREGLEWGVQSWDARLTRVLGLVLQCALNCGPGDIAQSPDCEEDVASCLQWADVHVQLIGGESFDHTVAQIGIKAQQGDTPTRGKRFAFTAMLSSPRSSL